LKKLDFLRLAQDFLFVCTKPLFFTARERLRERKEKYDDVLIGGGTEPIKPTIKQA
jgi:hypothetical protein